MTVISETLKINHREIMADAREALSGQWHSAALAFFVYILIAGSVGFIPFASLIISGPFALGVAIFSLNIARGGQVEISQIFDGFKNFAQALVAVLLMGIIVVIGIILFIIPGIMAALGLSMTFFIMADEPEIGATDALRKSWDMMNGHKWDYFVLGLRFIPWMLLCILTLGIGIFWLMPYMQISYANYYRALKGDDNPMDDPLEHLVD